MTLRWDVGRDDSKDDYIAHVPGDINPRLARKCIDVPGVDVALWYVSRQHALEILPEAILSILVIIPAALTLPLVLGNSFLSGLMAALIVLAVAFFIFELWRWDNEIIYVSQSAISRRRWDWQKFQWDKEDYPFGNIGKIKTAKPLEFNFSRIQAGNVLLELNSGEQVTLPLTPSPYKLAKRMDQARRHGIAGHSFQGSSPWLDPTVEHFRD